MSEVNYRGWSISPPDYPAPWTAVGPNYDAWTGDEEGGGWSDNGEKADAPTREALIAEIDAWFEENEPPADELSKARMEAITLGCEWQDIAEQLQAARNTIERLEAENRQMREALEKAKAIVLQHKDYIDDALKGHDVRTFRGLLRDDLVLTLATRATLASLPVQP